MLNFFFFLLLFHGLSQSRPCWPLMNSSPRSCSMADATMYTIDPESFRTVSFCSRLFLALLFQTLCRKIIILFSKLYPFLRFTPPKYWSTLSPHIVCLILLFPFFPNLIHKLKINFTTKCIMVYCNLLTFFLMRFLLFTRHIINNWSFFVQLDNDNYQFVNLYTVCMYNTRISTK